VSLFKADPSVQSYVRKVLLKLSASDQALLDSQSKIATHFQNKLVEISLDLRKELLSREKPCSYARSEEILQVLYGQTGLRDLVPGLKVEHKFYNAVHSSPLKNIAMNLSKGIKAHQKKQQTGSGLAGWPAFKKWKSNWTSLEYEEPSKGWKLHPERQALELSFGVNEQGQRLHAEFQLAEYSNRLRSACAVRVIKELGKYYACFTLKRPKENPPRRQRQKRTANTDAKNPLSLRLPKGTPRVIYIDPNQKNFGYALDNEGHAMELDHLGLVLKRGEQQIDYLKSKLKGDVRKTKRKEFTRPDGSVHVHYEHSRRYKRLKKQINRVHRRQREQKKQFMGSLANMLFANYDVVAIGDYVPEAIDHKMGRKYNRSVNNRTMHAAFKQHLHWVAYRSAKPFFVVNEKGTTRTCSACGYVVESGIAPDIRRWRCQGCESIHLRDENACINGLTRLEQSGGVGCRILPRSGLEAVLRSNGRCLWDDKGFGWEFTLLPCDFKFNASHEDLRHIVTL